MDFSKKFLRVVCLVLMVLILVPAMPSFAATFKDVSSTHWAYEYIEKMAKIKYISGYEDGAFKPKGTLTFLETIQLLSKLLNLTDDEVKKSKESYSKLVTDLKIPTWAQDAVMKSLYKGVLSESELKNAATKGLLDVGTNKRVGRLDISIFMAKAMGLQDLANNKSFVSLTYKDLYDIDAKYHKLIYVLVEAGVLSAEGTGNGYFEPSSPLLREQMAKMLSTAYDYLQKKPPVVTPPPVPVVETETVTGVITKITKLGTNTFLTVKSKTEEAYLVDAKTTIKLDGKATTITSLFEGQSVKVTITKGTATAVSVEAENIEEDITGTIKSLTPASNKLVVEYVKDKTTKTIELIVDKNTEITLNGEDADLYDLNSGDEVNLLIENNLVIELEATAKFGEVEGIIVDLTTEGDTRNPVYSVTIENSKKVKIEYELDEDASIYKDGRRADFKDLKLGDEAVIELEYGLIVDIDAEMVEKDVKGSITKITLALSGTQVTIKNKETNKEETYTLARNAIIKVDGVTKTINEVSLGYFVEMVVGGNEIIVLYADSVGAESIVRGKITSVSTRRNEIEIEIMTTDISDYAYGDEITIKVPDKILITEGLNNKLVFEDLARNMTVYIFGYYDGYEFTASEINIR